MVDEDLIKRVKNKEEAAFRKLYDIYSEKIYKTVYMMIDDKASTQDIVQEVFIKIYVKISSLKHISAFNSWIYRMTINCCLSYMHDNSKLKLLFDEEELNSISEEKVEFNPEDSTLKRDLYKEIMDSIYELPNLQRISIILYFYNDLTIKEIALIMECTEGTVKSRLFHGKKNLKKFLEYKNRKCKCEVNEYGFRSVD